MGGRMNDAADAVSAVKVSKLVKRYGDMLALDYFDLDVHQGEIFGLLGPNGSGKTTAINCILALLTFDEGTVRVFGEPISPTSYALKRRIGIVPQNVAVFNELTVTENIDYFCSLYVPDKRKRAPLVEEAVAFTGTATEDATVTVRSNRQWTVAYEDEETQKEWMYFKVSGNEVSEGIYNGDGTVKITVGESAQPHMGRLIFTLSNSYGELYRKYLTVTQGNYVPPTVGAVGKLVEYILGNSDLSGAVGSDKAMPLQYSESTIEAVILANDAAGNNNRKLYVGDNNGLERSAIVLYGADFAMANDPVTKYPAGRKVTLNLENAKYYAFNNVRQLTDVVVTVGDEEVELVVPSLSVEKFNTGDYQAQYVKLNNMTPAQSFVGKPWTATESQSVTLNDASGKTLTVYMNKAQFATGFADMYVADKTGTIYGVAETYRENAQLIPTKKTDIAALSTDQGGGTDPDPTPGDAIYYESFGTADVSDKPLIADYTGWAKTGSGAGEVSYLSLIHI